MRSITRSILFFTLVLSACSPAFPLTGLPPATDPTTHPSKVPPYIPPESTSPGSTEMSPTITPTLLPGGSTENAARARQDLAQRLGMSAEDITVSAVIGQEFTADAFYCRSSKDRIARDAPPESISGFVILLRAADRRYEYHASDREVIFCRLIP